MNKRRLAGIARWLERGAKHKKAVVGFNMRKGIHYVAIRESIEETYACGSICCIAGAAVQFYNKPLQLLENQFGVVKNNLGEISYSSVENEAIALLGLPRRQAEALFGGHKDVDEEIKPKQAARVIRHLIATGEVDWCMATK